VGLLSVTDGAGQCGLITIACLPPACTVGRADTKADLKKQIDNRKNKIAKIIFQLNILYLLSSNFL